MRSNTPLRDSVREGHKVISRELRKNGATLGLNETDTAAALNELAKVCQATIACSGQLPWTTAPCAADGTANCCSVQLLLDGLFRCLLAGARHPRPKVRRVLAPRRQLLCHPAQRRAQHAARALRAGGRREHTLPRLDRGAASGRWARLQPRGAAAARAQASAASKWRLLRLMPAAAC